MTPEPTNEAPFRALLEAPRGQPLALLHSCGSGPARLFTAPLEVLTLAAADWPVAFTELDAFLAAHAGETCVGYLGYDLRDAVEALPRSVVEDFPVPVLHVCAYDGYREWIDAAPPPPPPVPAARSLRAHVSRAEYERRVAAVIEHILAGDIFQANLTQPFTGAWDGDPRVLFWRLCHASPAPFCTYLELGDGTAILSSSPEEFLSLDGDAVRTRPIKGTRPRGGDAQTDAALLAELRASEKDRAELAMIVDLMRNDLGKVARPGSVAVGPFPQSDSFAQVHHLFATVTAQLRDDVGVVDLLRATFPPGSITGAPKLRAMEVIEDLELVRRGVYTGAIGQIGPGRSMHLNVAIRTMVHRDGRIRFNTGGGITADSDPGREFDETLHKAAGMVRALGARIELPADLCWVDGAFTDAARAISAAAPGFQLGLGVFETMGARSGALPLWARHLARLQRGAEVLGLPCAPPAELERAARELLARSGRADGVLRVTLAAADGGATWSMTTRARGAGGTVRLGIATPRRSDRDPTVQIKTTSRAFWHAALASAPDECDDVVVLDTEDRLCETAYANLWFRRSGVWHTPDARRCLPGIARAVLLEGLRARGERVEEGDYDLDDLHRSDAIFVTNAVHGPRPALLVDGPPVREARILSEIWERAVTGSG